MASPISLAWAVPITVFQAVAVLTTAYRLGYRSRTCKLSWDDLAAAVAMVLDAVFLGSMWMGRYIMQHPRLWNHIVEYRIMVFWIMTVSFNTVVWTTRVSIALSLVRVLAPGTAAKKLSVSMVAAFIVMYLIVMSEKGWVCGRSNEWHYKLTPDCPQGWPIAVTQLTTDVISSVALVAFPLCVLWGVHLPPTERRLILSLFATSIVQTVMSAAHAVYIFDYSRSQFFVTAQFDAAISLTFCNLLVIVTRFYRSIFPCPAPLPNADTKTTSTPQARGVDEDVDARVGFSPTTVYTFTEVMEMSFERVDVRTWTSSNEHYNNTRRLSKEGQRGPEGEGRGKEERL